MTWVFYFFDCLKVTLATFATYVLSDPEARLDANKAFVTLSLFNILQFPISFIPEMISFTAQVLLISFKVLLFSFVFSEKGEWWFVICFKKSAVLKFMT